nr:MAG TPA: hypothetical protein [Caudoviricetes sp.]
MLNRILEHPRPSTDDVDVYWRIFSRVLSNSPIDI